MASVCQERVNYIPCYHFESTTSYSFSDSLVESMYLGHLSSGFFEVEDMFVNPDLEWKPKILVLWVSRS